METWHEFISDGNDYLIECSSRLFMCFSNIANGKSIANQYFLFILAISMKCSCSMIITYVCCFL